MRKLVLLLALASLGAHAGCAGALTVTQREALLQRLRDQGNVAKNAVRARDEAKSALSEARGLGPRDYDLATLAFIESETAELIADVRSALR